MKDADASAVTLQGWQDERLMLVIEDDGSGLPPGSSAFWPHRNARARNGAGVAHISCLHCRVSVFVANRYV